MKKVLSMSLLTIAVTLGQSFVFAASANPAAKINELLPEMISVESGTFKMGDIAGEGDANELPIHEVSVKSFSLAKYEVTMALFDLFSETTGYPKEDDLGWGRGQQPAANVTRLDALALIEWINKETGRKFRLPTEAEWEYAARAGTDTAFPWGDTITRDQANYGPTDCCAKGVGAFGNDKWENSSPVGSFIPNPWGFHDIIGNVWEWTADCWNDSFEGAPTDGSAWMEGDCARGPLRGGSLGHYSRNMRSANRNDNLNEKAGKAYGMRLAEDR